MTLDLRDCSFVGPALPMPFIRFELGAQLARLGLLSTRQGAVLEQEWATLRRQFPLSGGTQRLCRQIIAPLGQHLGFQPPTRQEAVATREGSEDGGWLMRAGCGAQLRAWTFAADTDLDAPHRTGRAYRFSPMRSAQRVLLATGERLGLLTDGEELRLLLCDPARPDSHIAIPLSGSMGWRSQRLAPDSYRLILALASPQGIAALPTLLDAARLSQARVTKDLRSQARDALEGFLQAVLDHPANAAEQLHQQATTLWKEGLILVYRLLFILKLESASDPARAFSFASTDLWRSALSPNLALGSLVRRLLDQGHDTGHMLEDGLRLVFRAFRDGLSCSELSVMPLGGALFGASATPLLDRLAWGERAVALLLDRLLWTTPRGRERERVHYGALDVEELGRIYEALLELEPGIAVVPMIRLRRAKLEVVQPAARARRVSVGGATRQVEEIPAGRFFLRAGTGRKATGSYYTPHPFVRFLVRETLAPQVAARSPDEDPHPGAILALKVIDPATGSGHFLVEACRYLGEALYSACRACDEQASAALEVAERASSDACEHLLARAAALRQRVADLPDPDGMLVAYLPSRSNDGGSGLSEARALAICRRLVAVHCLYGVDSNPLAIELAKLSLWLESYAEGLPLTFLDHRLVCGDSIAGPFFASLTRLPVGGAELDPLLAGNVATRLRDALTLALREVRSLQATIGADAADLALKAAARSRLDATLRPLRLLAQAWSGAVMLATRDLDDEWQTLARAVAEGGAWPDRLTERQAAMLTVGSKALPWDLMFPEVFRPDEGNGGFNTVLGNPPWDMMQPNLTEFLTEFEPAILDAETKQQAHAIQRELLLNQTIANGWSDWQSTFRQQHRLVDSLYEHQKHGPQGKSLSGKLDVYRMFTERSLRLLGPDGALGMVAPSAVHASEGASGIRRLLLEKTRFERCLSFENRNSLFDIHARCKFALIVARRPGPTKAIRCGFYMSRFEQIDSTDTELEYQRAFIESSGGKYATLLELRDRDALALARQMFMRPERFGPWAKKRGIVLSRELNMTDDAAKFVLASQSIKDRSMDGYLVLHEGKTIHQFTDRRSVRPRYLVGASSLASKPQAIENTRYYRAACREIASSTNERTTIATLLPPGVLCGHTISVERSPGRRPNADALAVVGILNSFGFDWLLRQKAATHVSLFMLSELPVPQLTFGAESFLAHATLRLCCNHAGYAPLWQEQLGSTWREPEPPWSWPAIADESDRWHLRAAMDAVVAHSYDLNRTQYEHILQSFSHRSFPAAPSLCLAAFDALADSGLAAFTTQHDPYHDIPLVTTPAQPTRIGVSPSSGVSNAKQTRGKRCSTTPRLSTTS